MSYEMECSCPQVGFLNPIDEANCGVDFKQIQRLGFQRMGDKFDIADFDIKALSSWQAKIAVDDDTKIVLTPMIGGDPVISAGDPITEGGGGNDTLNGVEELNGSNPSVFTANFKSLPAHIIRQLQSLKCEKRLVVYFFLQGGSIAVAEVTPGTKDVYTGVEVSGQVFVSDRNNDGFGTKDKVSIQFSLPAGWSTNTVVVKPNFNPLIELKSIA